MNGRIHHRKELRAISESCHCADVKQANQRKLEHLKSKANKPHEIIGIHLMHSQGQPRRNAVGEQRPSQQRAQSTPQPRKSNPTPLPWILCCGCTLMMCSGGAKKLIVRSRICWKILELIFCTNGAFFNCDEYE